MAAAADASIWDTVRIHAPYGLRAAAARIEGARTPETADLTLSDLHRDLQDWRDGIADSREPTLPPPLGMDALLALEEPEEDWLAEGILPAGGNILCAAYPKSFKTMTALETGVSLATATPLFGRFHVPVRRRTGLVLMEDQAHRIRHRLKRLLLGRGMDARDLEGWLHFWFRPPLRLIDDAAMVDLGNYARELKLDLLIVDSWAYVASGDANDASVVTPQLARLSELRDARSRLTVWLTHHARKGQGGDRDGQRITDIVRNSSAFGAWHEACLLLERQTEDSNTIKIRTEFRDIESTGAFAVAIEDEYPASGDRLRSSGWLRMRALDDDPGVALRRDAGKKLVPAVEEFLASNPGCNMRQLRSAVRGRGKAVDEALDLLVREGKATKDTEGGSYRISLTTTPEGGTK